MLLADLEQFIHAERHELPPLVRIALLHAQGEYYRLLSAVRTQGGWEAWVGFFLDAVTGAATDCECRSQVTGRVRCRGRTQRATQESGVQLPTLHRYPVQITLLT